MRILINTVEGKEINLVAEELEITEKGNVNIAGIEGRKPTHYSEEKGDTLFLKKYIKNVYVSSL